MIRNLAVLFCLCAVTVRAVPVDAQSIVIVPPMTGQGIASSEVESAVALWLTSHDRRVVPSTPQLRKDLEPCLSMLQTSPPPCAAEYLKRSGADQAIVTWVEENRAQVALLIDDDLYYGGLDATGTFALNAWPDALEQALVAARRRETRGLGPWLEVSGFPSEAEVYVDGEYVGHLDRPFRLTQGGHQIEVKASGYQRRYAVVSLPMPTSHAVLRINLEPAAPDAPLVATRNEAGEASASSSSGRWLWRHWKPAVGTLLLVTGTALLAAGAWAEKHDTCETTTCERALPERTPRLLLTSGALAAGVGGAFIAASVYARLKTTTNSAEVAIGGSF